MKWLIRVGLLFPVIILAVALFVAYVALSNNGLQRVLALAADKLPGDLTWNNADGKLAGPLALAGFKYSDATGQQIAVDTVQLDWQPSALLGGTVQLSKLQLDGIDVHLPSQSTGG